MVLVNWEPPEFLKMNKRSRVCHYYLKNECTEDVPNHNQDSPCGCIFPPTRYLKELNVKMGNPSPHSLQQGVRGIPKKLPAVATQINGGKICPGLKVASVSTCP